MRLLLAIAIVLSAMVARADYTTNMFFIHMGNLTNGVQPSRASVSNSVTSCAGYKILMFQAGVEIDESTFEKVTGSTNAHGPVSGDTNFCNLTTNYGGTVGIAALTDTNKHFRIVPTHPSTGAVACFWFKLLDLPLTDDAINGDYATMYHVAGGGSTQFVNLQITARAAGYRVNMENPGGTVSGGISNNGSFVSLPTNTWLTASIARGMRGTNCIAVHDASLNFLGGITGQVSSVQVVSNFAFGSFNSIAATVPGYTIYSDDFLVAFGDDAPLVLLPLGPPPGTPASLLPQLNAISANVGTITGAN